MTSAVALGHASLRLRSRRVRSGRPQGLSPVLVVAVIAIASGVGFFSVGAILNTQAAPVVDAGALERQQLAAQLKPIDDQLQRSIAQEGLLVAAYQGGQIDRAELQRRLTEILAGYRDAASQVNALDPPPQLTATLKAEEEALNALTGSAVELSQAYDDGDQARVSAALAHSLAATARLHALTDIAPRD
jgi:hypothetical protein